jgi:hypothetical protein
MIPSTAERVPAHTAKRINARIHQEMLQRLNHYQRHPEEINQRLSELDQEWDIERTLEANASALISSSVLLSLLWGSANPFTLLLAYLLFCFSMPSRDGVRHCRFFDGWGTGLRLKLKQSAMH